MVRKQLRISLVTTALFTILTGIAYPLLVTGIGQALFPRKANGSLMKENGRIVGSELIGQPFSKPEYFWGRLSATAPYAYNAGASTGSNLGPTNPALVEAAEKRIGELKRADPTNDQPIPVDLVTASGSGLDPDISVAAAEYQVGRVARSRGLTVEQVQKLVHAYTEGRQFGFLGEPRVNVLELNMGLDRLQDSQRSN